MIQSTDSIAERRTAATSRVAHLEQQSGIALLDGKDVPEELQEEIAAQRAELISLEHAEGELVRRQREAAATEHAANVKALRKRFADHEAKRLDAMARAEMSASHLVSALRDAITAGNEMSVTMAHLGKAPAVQLGIEFTHRLSGLLSGLLASVTGKPNAFGRIMLWQLPNTQDWREPTRSWREYEQKIMAAVVAEISPSEEGN